MTLAEMLKGSPLQQQRMADEYSMAKALSMAQHGTIQDPAMAEQYQPHTLDHLIRDEGSAPIDMKWGTDVVMNMMPQAGIAKRMNWLDATGDAVVGDTVKFTEGVFEWSFRNPKFLGEREITGKIVKDSYGTDKQQHTFSIKVDGVSGYGADDVLGKAKKTKDGTIRRKARNIYRNKTMRQAWDDESARGKVLDEKHGRRREARAVRDVRRESE